MLTITTNTQATYITDGDPLSLIFHVKYLRFKYCSNNDVYNIEVNCKRLTVKVFFSDGKEYEHGFRYFYEQPELFDEYEKEFYQWLKRILEGVEVFRSRQWRKDVEEIEIENDSSVGYEYHTENDVIYSIEIDLNSNHTILKLPDETLYSDNFQYFADHSNFLKTYENGNVYRWVVRVLQSAELGKGLSNWTEFPS